jgi:hypothetical protein
LQNLARSPKLTPFSASQLTSAAIWCAEPSPGHPGVPSVPKAKESGSGEDDEVAFVRIPRRREADEEKHRDDPDSIRFGIPRTTAWLVLAPLHTRLGTCTGDAKGRPRAASPTIASMTREDVPRRMHL